MTHKELADILMEIEGQRRALVDYGYTETAATLQNKIGRLCSEHIIMVVSSLKFWDAPLAITKELVDEQINKRRPHTPTRKELKEIQ
jgi:hypothetical protein